MEERGSILWVSTKEPETLCFVPFFEVSKRSVPDPLPVSEAELESPDIPPYETQAVNRALLQNEVDRVFQILAHYVQYGSEGACHPTEELRSAGRELFSRLIPSDLAELLREQEENSYLILLLGKDLLWIPWELLFDGKFFCERFRLARWVEQTVAERKRAKERFAMKRSLGAVTVCGDLRGLGEAWREEEAAVKQALSQVYDSPDVRAPGKLRRHKILDELHRDSEIFHFVGHAEFESNDEKARGWACDRGEILTCGDIRAITTEAKFPYLIFANACGTAHARAPGEFQEYLGGLYLAFLHQGVPHYIGTLDRVPDGLSGAFAAAFYAKLAEGTTIGDALWQARCVFLSKPGTPIWAYYVHYGDPLRKLISKEERPREETGPLPPKPPWWMRVGLQLSAGLALLVALLGWWGWHDAKFPDGTFGVALAPFVVKDVAAASSERIESLLSRVELESSVRSSLTESEFTVRQVRQVFRSHNEARQWGLAKNAAVVIWGSAERGTSGVVVHVKGTRVLLPETSLCKETFKRFFLRMMFKDQFRDDDIYATDFNLSDLSFDLSNPKAMNSLHQQAGALAGLIRGVVLYSQGEYRAASQLLENVAARKESPDVVYFAKKWLVLSYLNAKEYGAALRVFSEVIGEGTMSDEDRVRLGFLRRCYERFALQIEPSQRSDWVGPLRQAASSKRLPPELEGVCATLLAKDMPRFVPQDFAEIAELQPLIESAVVEAPDSYFLRYLLAMISAKPAMAEDALREAERLKPEAAEPHFGRALVLSRPVPPDTQGALREIEKAIAAEPSEEDYWFTKWHLLQVEKQETIGRANDEVRRTLRSFAEEFLRTPYGSENDRATIMRELAEEYAIAHEPGNALAVLKRLVHMFPDHMYAPTFGVNMAMRDLGAFQEAEALLQSAAGRTVWTGALEKARLELLWRRGSFDKAIHEYVWWLWGDPAMNDPRTSVVVLDLAGNILHTAGRYDDAEIDLREAKRLALRTPQTIVEHGAVDSFSFTIPQEDWKWKWATAFDLGLLHLSTGRYQDAVRQFEEATQELVRRLRRYLPQATVEIKYPYIIFLTRMCQGYAFLKSHNSGAAARSWWAATQHIVRFDATQEELQGRLADLQGEIQKDPYHVGSYLTQEVVELLVALKKYKEAASFIQANALHTRGDRANEYLATLLFLYLQQGDVSKAEQGFLDFARTFGGSPSFKSPLSGLNSSLYTGWFIKSYPAWSPDFFFDVISINPYPQERDEKALEELLKRSRRDNKPDRTKHGRPRPSQDKK